MTTIERIQTRSRDAQGLFIWAGLLFTLSVLLHNSDHLRRGLGHLDADVFTLGTLGIFIEVAVSALILTRHHLAPIVSVIAGVSLASGYVLVHFLPNHPWFSDSFTTNPHTSWMSWAAASGEIVGALLIVVAALAVMRAPKAAAVDAMAIPSEHVLRLVVVAFALSQVAAIAISFAQR